MSADQMPLAQKRKSVRLVWITLALAFSLDRGFAAQGQVTRTIDAFASEISRAIADSSPPINGRVRVMTTDGQSFQDAPVDLVAAVTKSLYDSLASKAQAFDIVTENDYRKSMKPTLVPATADSQSHQTCSSDLPEPSYSIAVFVEQRGENAMLRAKVTRLVEPSLVFDREILIPVSPEIKALAAQLKSASKEAFDSASDVVWTRPGFEIPGKIASSPGTDGCERSETYTSPRCTDWRDCPRAEYSDTAVRAHIEGKISLKVLVDTEGRPAQIIMLKGIPCDLGLNQSVVDSVSRWKMTPARDSSGVPVASWVLIEESFSLY